MQASKILRNGLASIIVLGMTMPLAGFAKAPTASAASATDAQSVSSAVASADTFSENPGVELPDKIATSIPDDAQFVARDYVQTADGKLLSAESGNQVTDPEIVGTEDEPADPLAKSDGQKFIPQEVSTVRGEISENGADGAPDDIAQGDTATDGEPQSDASSGAGTAASEVRYVEKNSTNAAVGVHSTTAAALQNSDYGAYWGTYQGTQAFFEKSGSMFVQQAKGVIDVSEWQSDINWDAVKASGVEGAIIRIGYSKSSVDKKAARNISECKRLGIPFGIYMYSYASNAAEGTAEGEGTASRLKSMGVSAKDLSYPVYYDLENWVSGGNHAPTDPGTWDGIVNNWWIAMQQAGYDGHLGVYSYTSFLNTSLNTGNIHSKTGWVAQYGPSMQFSKYGYNSRGWQYWSSGSVSGITGNVDLNAFGNKEYVSSGPQLSSMGKVSIPNGNYYINTSLTDALSIEIPGASAANGTQISLYTGNGTAAQQFTFTQQPDGSYVIKNVFSGKVLDVEEGIAFNKAVVQQFDANGSSAQKWFLRDAGNGAVYLQSALGNWALDLSNFSIANGSKLTLYSPNESAAQKYIVASTNTITTDQTVKIASKGNRNVVVDIPGASKSNGAQTQLYTWNSTSAQVYSFKKIGNGTYNIVNANSSKYVEVAAGSTSNGAIVQQYSGNGTAAQRWIIRDAGDGAVSLLNRASGKSLDVPAGNIAAGTNLQIYTSNSSNAQAWYLDAYKVMTKRGKLDELAATHRSDAPDGTYQVGSQGLSSMRMDIVSGFTDDGTNVDLYTSNGSNAQKWRITHDSKGYVTIANPYTGKVLDVEAAQEKNGTNIRMWSSNGSYAQKWIAQKNSDGSVVLISALNSSLVIDVEAGIMKNGTNIRIWSANGSAAQRWKLL